MNGSRTRDDALTPVLLSSRVLLRSSDKQRRTTRLARGTSVVDHERWCEDPGGREFFVYRGTSVVY